MLLWLCGWFKDQQTELLREVKDINIVNNVNHPSISILLDMWKLITRLETYLRLSCPSSTWICIAMFFTAVRHQLRRTLLLTFWLDAGLTRCTECNSELGCLETWWGKLDRGPGEEALRLVSLSTTSDVDWWYQRPMTRMKWF